MTLKTVLMVSTVAAIGLSGCTTTSKALGLTKDAPNEFNILTKAPLVVPPEYNLRPPRVGESSSENNYSQKAAGDALIGDIAAAEPTCGEIRKSALRLTARILSSASQQVLRIKFYSGAMAKL